MLDYHIYMWYNKDTVKEVTTMQNITKALQDLEKAVNSNDTVASVKVTITLKKSKPSKAKKTPDNK